MALVGQEAKYSGWTQTLGIQNTCPPEDAIVYGADTGTGIDYSIVHHIGYFRPKEAGTYTFQVDGGLKQSVYLWLGDQALAGWKNINANLIADGSWTVSFNTWLKVVSEIEVGTYIPIRILYVNAEDCGEFGMTVLDPNNAVLVTRDKRTDDGQFLSNCGGWSEIPSISFDPTFTGDFGWGGDGFDQNADGNFRGFGPNHNRTFFNVTLGGNNLPNDILGGDNLLNDTLGGLDLFNATLGGLDLLNATLGGLDLLNATLGGNNLFNDTLGGLDLFNATLGGDNGLGVNLNSSGLGVNLDGNNPVNDFLGGDNLLNVTLGGDNGLGVNLNSSGLGLNLGGLNFSTPLKA